MFFNFRKKAKLAEEARKQEQQRIQEATEKKQLETQTAFADNVQIFYNICHMVSSLPKKRHIVVIQRENVFKSNSDSNWAYLKLATSLHYKHQSTGQKWLSAYGQNNDSLYAFYEPTQLTPEFRQVLENFSEGGYRIQRIRYYSHNL